MSVAHNSTLESLDISCNRLGAKGVSAPAHTHTRARTRTPVCLVRPVRPFRPPVIATPPGFCAAVPGGINTYTDGLQQDSISTDEYIALTRMLGMQPADPIQRLVRKAQATLLQNEPYGCLHPRIEIDMVRSWKVNKGGAPPKLDVLLAAMGREPEVRKMARIFVAVGVAISA